MQGNRPFGDFLRSRRTCLKPDKVGDATRQRRRTPGLKREEVAQHAGISAEWYVKLEQGRAVYPSGETVRALGRALRLDAVEWFARNVQVFRPMTTRPSSWPSPRGAE